MSMQRSHASAAWAWSAKKARGMVPALLTMTSMAPKVSTAKAARANTSARSVTSVRRWATVPPAAVIDSAVAARPSTSMSAATTLAPRAATIWATSRPNPLAAPVTTTTFPFT